MSADIETRVRELLDELGDDRDKIAASLAAKGIKGQRTEGTACPIFNYLRSEGASVVSVDAEEIDLGYGAIRLPVPVGDFVWAFDDNVYPELVETAVKP